MTYFVCLVHNRYFVCWRNPNQPTRLYPVFDNPNEGFERSEDAERLRDTMNGRKEMTDEKVINFYGLSIEYWYHLTEEDRTTYRTHFAHGNCWMPYSQLRSHESAAQYL